MSLMLSFCSFVRLGDMFAKAPGKLKGGASSVLVRAALSFNGRLCYWRAGGEVNFHAIIDDRSRGTSRSSWPDFPVWAVRSTSTSNSNFNSTRLDYASAHPPRDILSQAGSTRPELLPTSSSSTHRPPHRMPLIDLPTELLDEVFSYLDWDPSRSLYPTRDDVLNASLTCRQLRKVLEPAIFRNVTLRLCWAEGRLIEPRWYCLRKQRPDIAKHRDNLEPFVVPEGVDDWLTLSNNPENSSSDIAHLRPRVDDYARRHIQEEPLSKDVDAEQALSAEDLIRVTKTQSRTNQSIDALSIFMLCIPASVNKIVFKAHMEGIHNKDKNIYSHRLLSIALDLLHDRLQDLTIISNQSVRRLGMSRRQIADIGSEMVDQEWIPTSVVQKLSPKRLTFAVNDEYSFHKNTTSFVHQGFQRWHQLSPTVRELDIRYTKGELNELVQFVRGFETLTTIRFQDCILLAPYQAPMAQTRAYEQHVWLNLAILIRQTFPHAKIELDNLWRPVIMDKLPNCAVNWILTQAVPEGALIGEEREERLMEDFEAPVKGACIRALSFSPESPEPPCQRSQYEPVSSIQKRLEILEDIHLHHNTSYNHESVLIRQRSQVRPSTQYLFRGSLGLGRVRDMDRLVDFLL
ncbi:hypothetical protein M409DRAFT_50707 [Zasmidium cellare ATCC 36951]|uniref:F-box domain-containing protein n=1 Tax=Zasmidium cellare ATCC 36951 TaxID=1080233 RepID=A0A6A6CVV0_ZASCE|nr:uncharacterized protein M409DRAFT_50707 [Zasmidium cellare ATCC 36951]KAF2171241.1 hypothetical protein M409DRAFT_50707 [Zasmidium cellare ATCC 36951]